MDENFTPVMGQYVVEIAEMSGEGAYRLFIPNNAPVGSCLEVLAKWTKFFTHKKKEAEEAKGDDSPEDKTEV